MRWLRANATTYGVDPSRIAIGGASAGAITALLVGRHAEDPGTSGNPGPSSAVRGVVSVSGGTPTNDFIDRGDPATIMFHGTADRTVFYSWAVQNAAAMLAAGVPVVLEPIEGAGHGLAAQYGALIDEQSDWFLYDVLDLAHAPGQPAAAARAAEAQARQLRARYGRLVR